MLQCIQHVTGLHKIALEQIRKQLRSSTSNANKLWQCVSEGRRCLFALRQENTTPSARPHFKYGLYLLPSVPLMHHKSNSTSESPYTRRSANVHSQKLCKQSGINLHDMAVIQKWMDSWGAYVAVNADEL